MISACDSWLSAFCSPSAAMTLAGPVILTKSVLEPTLFNMGHCFRRLRDFDRAMRFYHEALRIEPKNASTLAAIGQPTGLIQVAQLHGRVPIFFLGTNLQHVARAGFQDRHRDYLPRFIVDLRHPDLPAEYSLTHRSTPYGLSLAGR